MNWTELVMGDNYGTYEVDPEALSTTAELLERFTSESQVSNTSHDILGLTLSIFHLLF